MWEMNGCQKDLEKKQFRIFSEAWEVHTWQEAWKDENSERECKTFFRNPNANLPNGDKTTFS